VGWCRPSGCTSFAGQPDQSACRGIALLATSAFVFLADKVEVYLRAVLWQVPLPDSARREAGIVSGPAIGGERKDQDEYLLWERLNRSLGLRDIAGLPGSY